MEWHGNAQFPPSSNNLSNIFQKKVLLFFLRKNSLKNNSMLIGNRRRPQMQRTPSMPRITVEVDDNLTTGQDSDVAMTVVDGGDNYDQRFLGVLSPGNHRRNERKDIGKASLPSTSFLGNCGFCKRRLAPGRDIYMYKGDTAFCSVECREQQIEQDEVKTPSRTFLSTSNMHGSN